MKKNIINHKIRKSIFISIFLFIFLTTNFYSINTQALNNQDDNKIIVLNEKSEASASLFNEQDGLWAPGIKKTKSFYLQNNSSNNCSLNTINFSISLKDKYGNIITTSSDRYNEFNNSMNAILECDGKTLFNGKFSELVNKHIDFNNSFTLASKNKTKMNLTFAMDSNADSSLEGLKENIDISFKFTSLDGSSLLGSLVQTGSIIDTKVLVILGVILVTLGFIIIARRKKTTHR